MATSRLLIAALLLTVVLGDIAIGTLGNDHPQEGGKHKHGLHKRHRKHRVKHRVKHHPHPHPHPHGPRHPHHPPPPPPPPPSTQPPGIPGTVCTKTFGPWPPTVPAGSQTFNDGAHRNLSQLTVVFSDVEVNGLLVEYFDFRAGSMDGSFYNVEHGVQGPRNFTFLFALQNPQDTLIFRRIGGTYTDTGLDSITFTDSNDNFYVWGGDPDPFNPDPLRTDFQSPLIEGHIVGFFGAADVSSLTQGRLTQIGVCVTDD